MFKKLFQFIGILFLTGGLIACTSPEEKAANYIQNADVLLEEGKLKKAAIEYKNALQVNQNQPEAWFGLAKIHERKQEWRKAYVVLNKIREMAPKHVKGRIMLGQILLASNQLEQALVDVQEILELAPNNASAHALMAAVQFRLDNNKGAQEEIAKSLAIDPANDEAILVLGRVLIAEKNYQEALSVLDKSLKENPKNISVHLMKIQVYQGMGDQKAIEGIYVTLAETFPENLSFQHALARQYIAQKNIDSAESVMQRIVKSNPDNVEEKLRYASFLNQYRSVDDAIALVKSYIASYKDEFQYRFLLGELYEKLEQNGQAIVVYRSIINDDELKPNGLEARNKIASIDLRSGNTEKAKNLVKEILTHDKNNENALLLQAGFQIVDKKYDDAVVSARTVLRDNPESIKALGLLGQAYMAMGSAELAVESYIKAFQLSPGIPVTANELAKIYIRQRKPLQADEVLQESISQGNRSVEVLKLLAQTKLSLGEWGKAEQIAKQLEKVQGQEALSQQVLGVAYQGKEQREESVEAFKRAYELSPTSPEPIISVVRSYVGNGKIKDARDFLNSVLSVHKENITAYQLLGDLSLYEKKTPEAIKYYQKTIEIDPKLAASYRTLATVYLRENDVDKAVEVIGKGLTEMPGQPILTMYLASIYERQENFRKAIEIYESLLAENENLIVAKNNLASLLADYGGDQASLDKARMIAVELRDSKIPQFRDTYAWTLVKSGTNLEEAVVLLDGIVKENDQVDVYSYHLGEAYRKKGDSRNAETYLKIAVELATPGSDISEKAKGALQQLNK